MWSTTRSQGGRGTCLGHSKGLGGHRDPFGAQQGDKNTVGSVSGRATGQGDSGTFVRHCEGLRTGQNLCGVQ